MFQEEQRDCFIHLSDTVHGLGQAPVPSCQILSISGICHRRVSTCGVCKSLHPAQTHAHVRGTCCPTDSAFSPQLGGREGGSRWGDQHWLALTLSALRFGEEVLTAQPQCI